MNLFQSAHSFQDLNLQLKDFGLHPQDWVLLGETKKKIKIQHKEEDTFFFIGDVENQKGKLYWRTIQLAGL